MIARRVRRAAATALLAAISCRVAPAPPPETAWGVVPIIGTGFRISHAERGPWVEFARRAIAYARIDAYTGFGYIARPRAIPDFFDPGVDARLAELAVPGRRLVAFVDLLSPPPEASEIEATRLWEEAAATLGAASFQLASRGVTWFLVGDEPNSSGDPEWAERTMERLRRACATIRKNAPDAVVIAGNVAGGDPEVLLPLYRRGLAKLSDAIGYHPRPRRGEAFPIADARGAARIVLGADGPRKPLFFGRGWGPAAIPSRPHHDLPLGAEEVLAVRRHLVEGARAIRSLRSPVLGALFHPFNDSYAQLADGTFSFDGRGLADIWANAKDDLLDLFPGDRPSLANPGFELAPFDAEGAWTAEGDARATEGTAHAGSRCVRLAPGSAIRQETAPGSAAAGEPLELRLYLRSESGRPASAQAALLFLDARGGILSTAERTIPAEAGPGGDGWTHAFVRAAPPEGADRAAAILRHASGDVILADDILLYEGPAPGRLAAASILVRDDRGEPIPSGEIRIGPHRAETGPGGEALLFGIEPGAYDVIASAPGFRTEVARDQILRPDRRRPIHFVLIAQDRRLPARFEAAGTGAPGEIEIRFDPPAPGALRFSIVREGPEGKATIEVPADRAAAGFIRDPGLRDGALYLYRPSLRPPEGWEREILGPARAAIPRDRARPGSGG